MIGARSVPRWLGWLRAPNRHDVELRRGIERVLHDEVAIRLSAMVLHLDLVTAAARGDAALCAKVSAARVAVCHAIEDVRRLSGVVFSPVLRGAGLAPALRATAESREVRLRLDLPTHDMDVAVQHRVGLLVTDRLHLLCPGSLVRVRVRGTRLVRVCITEKRPDQRARRYWAVTACR